MRTAMNSEDEFPILLIRDLHLGNKTIPLNTQLMARMVGKQVVIRWRGLDVALNDNEYGRQLTLL